jgi:hypothetical protein
MSVIWATSATPLPMWDPEGSGMVPVPNMVADFSDRGSWLDPDGIAGAIGGNAESTRNAAHSCKRIGGTRAHYIKDDHWVKVDGHKVGEIRTPTLQSRIS